MFLSTWDKRAKVTITGTSFQISIGTILLMHHVYNFLRNNTRGRLFEARLA